MTVNNLAVSGINIAERFAEFFDKKVKDIVSTTVVNPNVYNSQGKMLAIPAMFMTGVKILECISELKLKNTEGYDRLL